MKALSESRTMYVTAAQVVFSLLAATLTPGVDCAPGTVKILAALAAGCGVLIGAFRVQDKRRAPLSVHRTVGEILAAKERK